jgi:hypothetical protein
VQRRAGTVNDIDTLRAAVLREYDSYCERTGHGPCGAIAVALQRLGFGKVAGVYAISAEERDDCFESVFDSVGQVCFQHTVVIKSNGNILDIALPPDFKLASYELQNEDEDVLLGLYDEEDYRFWHEVLKASLQKKTEAVGGVPMKRGVRSSVLKRMHANRRRVADAREREEREAEAIRVLNKKQKEQS